MTGYNEIRERLRKISGSDSLVPFRTAEVIAATDSECSVKIGEMVITGVKLFSISEAGGLTIKPKVGTMVTVIDLSHGQLRDLVLVKVDHPEVIRYNQDGLTVEIDSVAKKVDIRNSSVSLTKLFTSLYDIISKLTVSTPAGPSGTPLPPTVAALEQFKTGFQQILK